MARDVWDLVSWGPDSARHELGLQLADAGFIDGCVNHGIEDDPMANEMVVPLEFALGNGTQDETLRSECLMALGSRLAYACTRPHNRLSPSLNWTANAGGLRGPAARQTPFQTPQHDAAVDSCSTVQRSARAFFKRSSWSVTANGLRSVTA